MKSDEFGKIYGKLKALAAMADAASQDYIPPFRAPEKIINYRQNMRTAFRQDMESAFQGLLASNELSEAQIRALGEITIQSPSPLLADEAIKIEVIGANEGFFSDPLWSQPDVMFVRGLMGKAGFKARCMGGYSNIMLERPKTTDK